MLWLQPTMPDPWPNWFSHPAIMGVAVCSSVVAALASIILVPRYLATLPCDYLVSGAHHAPSRSLPFRLAKNLLGLVLVALGVAMLVLPGQGLVTLLVGVMLLDIPGKQRLMQRMLGQPKVLRAVNALRQRRGQAPLLGCVE